MKDLSPVVLLVAFLIVGGAAWFLGRHAGGPRRLRMPRDYFIGLDHLINDRFDRATEVFARMAETDGDAAEIQFALGSLFRRRGEVDRAIRIHTRLRAEQPPPVADQASFALALDYLSAGLMDRAEQLLHEVAARDGYRAAALDQLLRVHEQQRDWGGALRVFHELPPDVQAQRSQVASHYLCELAELALAAGDLPRAVSLVEDVQTRMPRFARAARLRAAIAEAQGRPAEAIERYVEALGEAPQLLLEVAPRALALAPAAQHGALLDRIAGVLAALPGAEAARLVWALAVIVPPADLESAPALLAVLRERLEATAGASGLPGVGRVDVRALVSFAQAAQQVSGRYQCGQCGFRSVSWYWQCPGCRSWDAQEPQPGVWAEPTMRPPMAAAGSGTGPG